MYPTRASGFHTRVSILFLRRNNNVQIVNNCQVMPPCGESLPGSCLLAAGAAVVGAAPELVGGGGPVLGVVVALGAQIVYALQGGHIAGMGAGLVDDLPQLFGVLQHGTGAQHVVVEGLAVVIGAEEGGAQGFQQGLLADVGVRVVDEDAGVTVAVGVDVQVAATAGDTSADKLAVVLEVENEHGFSALARSDFTNPVVHVFSLRG